MFNYTMFSLIYYEKKIKNKDYLLRTFMSRLQSPLLEPELTNILEDITHELFKMEIGE